MSRPVQVDSLSERGIDASLCRHRVTSRRKQLRYACSVEASLSETECGSQTGTTCSNDQSIVLVVNHGVFVGDEGRGLFSAEGLVGDDFGSRNSAREAASLLASKAMGQLC